MMRYVCFVCEYLYDLHIEIHKPRNSTEFFTYASDKYWSKLLYGLKYGKTKSSILEFINKGNEFNLKKHWYEILCDKNYLSYDNVYHEITYYLYITDASTSEKEKKSHKNILNEDTLIANIIFYIINLGTIKRSDCAYLLSYVCCSWYITEKMITKFHEYLTSPPGDSSFEIECRTDIVDFLKKFL